MEVKAVGDAVLYVGALAAALVAIGGLFRFFFLKPLQRWIKEQVKDPLERQVSPNGGPQESTRHLVEEVHQKVNSLADAQEKSQLYARENRDLATAALSLAQQTSDRLDRVMEAQLALSAEEHTERP